VDERRRDRQREANSDHGATRRRRFRKDGGNLDDLDELDVEDTEFVVDLRDLRELVAGFHAEGNQRNYAACAAVLDWATFSGGTIS
jgi:hypothetical protein